MIGFGRTIKNFGGRATAPAMAKAESVAVGARNRTVVRHTGGGSSAGLNAEKTARIQPNGTGYDNPALHAKRKMLKEYPKGSPGTLNPTPHFSRKTLHRTNSLVSPKIINR